MPAIQQERFIEKDRFAPSQSIARSDPNVMQKSVLPLADEQVCYDPAGLGRLRKHT
jgi:hypothetical protein